MEVESARPTNRKNRPAPPLMAVLVVVVVLTLIAVGLVLAGPVYADHNDMYVVCPEPISEGETAHMQVARRGHRIEKLWVFTNYDNFTAHDGDFVAYHGDEFSNDSGSRTLQIPVITTEDAQPEHDETFAVGFWGDDVWHGCVITIDDDDLPEVTGVEISSRPARGDTYRAGESIDVTLTLDQEVEVVGRSMMALYLDGRAGSGWRGADYHSGSGTTALTFSYRVATADRDTDGLSVDGAAMAGDGNPAYGFGGDGQIVAKGTDVPIDYTHGGVGESAGHKVDGRPYARRALVTSSVPGGGYAYRANQVIEITLQFDTDVVIEGRVVAPFFLGFEVVSGRLGTLREAEYLRGSGSDALVFGYTVRPGDLDPWGIRLSSVSEEIDSSGTGTIKAKGTDVEWYRRYDGSRNLRNHKVDAVPPAISSIIFESRPSAGEAYGVGEIITVDVRFDEEVTPSGDPKLELDIGGTARQATLRTAATGETLVFQYEVQEGDTDTDGVGISANSLRLNGGDIVDRAGNAATLSHEVVAADPDQKVDTSPEA